MLSKTLSQKKLIHTICESDQEIRIGDEFDSLKIANGFHTVNSTFVYLGKIDGEFLFSTKNRHIFFSVRDGIGEKDGVLYGLKSGFFHDFGYPLDEKNITEEYKPTYTTWGGAMAYYAKKQILDKISYVL